MLMLSSCFRVEESVILSKDGSGIFNFKVDLSESKYVLQMAKRMSALYEGKSPDEKIDRNFVRAMGALESSPGISGSQLIKNDDDFIYEITFNFEDIKSLNTAVNRFIKKEDRTDEDFFKLDKKWFERTDAVDIMKMVNREMQNEKSQVFGMDPEILFKDVVYATTYVFDRKIKKHTNDKATVSGDKKEISLEYYVFRNEEDNSPENRIKLK